MRSSLKHTAKSVSMVSFCLIVKLRDNFLNILIDSNSEILLPRKSNHKFFQSIVRLIDFHTKSNGNWVRACMWISVRSSYMVYRCGSTALNQQILKIKIRTFEKWIEIETRGRHWDMQSYTAIELNPYLKSTSFNTAINCTIIMSWLYFTFPICYTEYRCIPSMKKKSWQILVQNFAGIAQPLSHHLITRKSWCTAFVMVVQMQYFQSIIMKQYNNNPIEPQHRESFNKWMHTKRIDALFIIQHTECMLAALERILSVAFGFAQFGRVFDALIISDFHLFIKHCIVAAVAAAAAALLLLIPFLFKVNCQSDFQWC